MNEIKELLRAKFEAAVMQAANEFDEEAMFKEITKMLQANKQAAIARLLGIDLSWGHPEIKHRENYNPIADHIKQIIEPKLVPWLDEEVSKYIEKKVGEKAFQTLVRDTIKQAVEWQLDRAIRDSADKYCKQKAEDVIKSFTEE